MSKNYSGGNVGGQCWISIYTLDQIASISLPDASNIVTIQLEINVSILELPVTPKSIEPSNIKKDSEHGEIWENKFQFVIPKISNTSRKLIESIDQRYVVVVYHNYNGDTFILGSLDMPMRITEVQRIEPSETKDTNGYQISGSGVSIDEPFFATVSDM